MINISNGHKPTFMGIRVQRCISVIFHGFGRSQWSPPTSHRISKSVHHPPFPIKVLVNSKEGKALFVGLDLEPRSQAQEDIIIISLRYVALCHLPVLWFLRRFCYWHILLLQSSHLASCLFLTGYRNGPSTYKQDEYRVNMGQPIYSTAHPHSPWTQILRRVG